jgi:hypothetical protein
MAEHPSEDHGGVLREDNGEALMCKSWLSTQVRPIVEDERVASVSIMPQLAPGLSGYCLYFWVFSY